jgi:hypothetical protein
MSLMSLIASLQNNYYITIVREILTRTWAQWAPRIISVVDRVCGIGIIVVCSIVTIQYALRITGIVLAIIMLIIYGSHW